MTVKNNEKTKELSSKSDENDTGLNAWESVKKFLSELFDLKSDTDFVATVDAVKKDISFKGHNAWILIFSIFVASIGLNVSSAAVVIGAMLISPLMGPIVGIGLAVSINDVETLRKSLINLGVMVVLSVFTAFLYFTLSPLTQETPELLARTYPTILDVLVAIFGGLGLIVAKTKSGTIASVIFGVAIATALMPPLCTVGYGLAVGNMAYAGGALYLFSINAVFIALSTFIVTKLLKFPLVRYANSKRRKRIAQVASLIALIVMIPSVVLFVKLLQVQLFESKAQDFVKNEINLEGVQVLKSTADYKNRDVDVYLIGRIISSNEISAIKEKLKEIEILREAHLNIYQGSDQGGRFSDQFPGGVKADILEDLYVKNEQLILDKDEKIRILENEISKLNSVPFEKLSKEVKINYEEIDVFAYSREISTNFEKIDTLTVFSVTWKKNTTASQKEKAKSKLGEWLKIHLKLDTLQVRD